MRAEYRAGELLKAQAEAGERKKVGDNQRGSSSKGLPALSEHRNQPQAVLPVAARTNPPTGRN
jgi:hypothetical protein